MVEPSLSYLVCVFQVVSGEPQQVVFTIPIFEPMPSQYYISAVSDRWLGSEAVCIINFQHLILPERHPPHTGTVQQTHTHRQTNPQRCTEETTLHTSHIHLSLSFFLDKCTHTLSQCCPVDSQSCWTCSRCPSPPWGTRSTRVCTSSPTSIPSRHRSTQIYHTDTNVLLGAPTGSGKTIAAELAMFRVFNQYPTSKVCLPPSLYLSIFLFQYRSTFLSVYPCSVCVLRWCTLPL